MKNNSKHSTTALSLWTSFLGVMLVVILIMPAAAVSQSYYTISENSSPVFSTIIPDQAYVIKDNVEYKLYYAGNDFASINLATSPDGIIWTPYFGNPVLIEGPLVQAEHADVHFYSAGFAGANSGTNASATTMYYRMWYQGTAAGIGGWRYAESPDGINWHNQMAISQFGTSVTGGFSAQYGIADVVYTPGASNTGTDWTFRIYVNAQYAVAPFSSNELPVLAFSSNGYNWTGYDPTSVGHATPVFTPTLDTSRFDCDHIGWFKVIKNSTTDWQAFYSGGKGTTYQALNGIGYATSTDGINWTHRQTLFTTRDTMAWRNQSVWMPSVVKSGSNYEIFFLGSENAMTDGTWIWWKLGRAVLTPVTNPLAAVNFIEYAGNPLFGGATSGTDRAYQPYVIKIGGVYNMWYGDGANARYTSSTYPDFHDALFPGTIVTGTTASQPYKFTVYYNPDGWTLGSTHYSQKLVAYYADAADGWTSNPKIAVSDDGIVWTYVAQTTGVNVYPSAGTFYRLSVLYEGNGTWKGYGDQGQAIIQYYTSANGIDWTGVATDLLSLYTPSLWQPWESGAGAISPYVFKVNSTYVMTYSAGLTNNDQGIGIAYSGNGVNFTKSSTNPIFSIGDGITWRTDRTYNGYIMSDGGLWRMYFQGKNATTGVYAVGMATSGVPLPVELVALSAKADLMNADLHWSTSTETNNFGFEIQRRQTANWEKIGFVKGAGTSSSPRDYSYIDQNLSPGKYSYRIKQIDRNGLFKYFGNGEIEIAAPAKFALEANFPNPFNPSTTISYGLPAQSHVRLQIYNTLGQIVADLVNAEQAAGWNQVMWNAKVASGLYFYRLEAVSVSDPNKRFVDVKKMLLLK